MAKKKRDIRREGIMEEAAKLFKQKGFGGTSMRDLAEQVGMDAATMYHYIKSKDEILKTICFDIAHTYVTQLAEMEASPFSYTQKLKALVRLHIHLMTSKGAEVSVANNDWKFLSEEALQEFKGLRNQYERSLASIIEQGIKAGELKDVHPSVALFTLLSAVRWVELWWKPDRGVTTQELEDSILAILFSGLENTKP
ncbi:TetR/AcrR family transcriptional regulator [Rufibacter glacialis]|uniref:TetR/AcrR family transcriptional regulator n=1 Tax=Rufibacter glacialis TaxID=1259555 RepID=A0A5M8QIW8_9BACT|nr:TetR/AcrR family transcriptional regulator [Rufibacter glacialis]KAA6434312.1 TetR/AcrR family transcriptional regulator [Rufibacter glacialis]GGK68481.1 TetR family transcriptional regulator [Rufibacter glacialis]